MSGRRAPAPQPPRLANIQFMEPDASLRVFHQRLVAPVETHWHEFYELACIVGGSATHLLNGVPDTLEPGSVYLLTPADVHAVTFPSPAPTTSATPIPTPRVWEAEGEAEPAAVRAGARLELYNVIFTEQALDPDLRRLLFDAPSTFRARTATLAGEQRVAMAAEFRRLWAETERPRPGQRRIMQGALERILIDLQRASDAGGASGAERHAPATGASLSPAMSDALAYLHYHFREALTLDHVARQVHLSPTYFSEQFHRVIGTPFHAYLRGVRLRFAASLLLASELSIGAVCEGSGFQSLSAFERAFAHAYGRSPRLYRRAIATAARPGPPPR